MAPPTRRFANHPGAKEAPASALEYRFEEDKNPELRGIPLVIASLLVENLQWLRKLLWANAGFGRIESTPGLENVNWRIQPNVIALSDTNSPTSMLELHPSLQLPQPTDLPGRFYSIADYHDLYKSGEVTPLQVVETLLPLIRRDVQPQSKYAVAWTHCNVEEVLAAARASTERWAAGKPLGILDGVPFGVKDDLEVKGYVSTRAMKVNKAEAFFNKPEQRTIWPAKVLEDAGAIMVGKMNQQEVGMDTNGLNPRTGTATNWYNKSYFPGGSSSGAASALSGGLVPITVGTDAGGSVRIPMAFCGVYGLKPTFNRLCSRSSSVCVVGPMTSTVADLTIAFRIMAQPDPEDPDQNLFAVSVPPEPSAKKYIGICREWIDRSAPDVKEVFDKAVAHLTSQMGYETVEIKLPFLREGQIAHAATCLAEAVTDARSRVKNPSKYLSVLNYPNRIMVGMGQPSSAVDYLKCGQIRQVIMQHLAFLFDKYPGLLILTPTTPVAGWPIHPGDQKYGCSNGNMTVKSMTFAWYANTSGCPAVSCPAGYVNPAQGEGKLPVGLMAMGEWGAEEQLLGFAGDAERYLHEVYPGGRQRPAEWADVIGMAKEKAGR
ncbi:N-acylethanolamine amidohydrolase [Madurella fahalii]|uniref:N-acylethanolamine amidohydrolase n=1 Tax=Madurella fahalii TaxID=1157608 RepID=A0ABQ0FX77_9PEZI